MDAAGRTVAELVKEIGFFAVDRMALKREKAQREATMKTVQKILLIIAAIFFTAQVHAVMYLSRPYEPNMGRWLTRDPIGEGAGFVQRDPLPQSGFIPLQRNEPNLYGFVRNDPLNYFDALGLFLQFENESCQGCNASDPFNTHRGYIHVPAEIPCKWATGAGGSFAHGCANVWPYTGLCNTETHISIRAKNDSCCKQYRITCTWAYSGTATGTDSAKINVQLSFLGSEFDRLRDMQPSASTPSGPYTARRVAGGLVSKVVSVPYGSTISVFGMNPFNFVFGRPDSITEAGEVTCTADCVEGR